MEASERAHHATGFSQLDSYQRAGDGLLHLLLPDRAQKLSVLRQAAADDIVHHDAAALPDLDVRRVLIAEVEIDGSPAARRPAPARVALGVVVAHPSVEDGHLFAGRDGPGALDPSRPVRE